MDAWASMGYGIQPRRNLISKKRLNPRNRDKAHQQRRKPTESGVADRNLLRNRTHVLRKICCTRASPGSGAHERRCLSLCVISVVQFFSCQRTAPASRMSLGTQLPRSQCDLQEAEIQDGAVEVAADFWGNVRLNGNRDICRHWYFRARLRKYFVQRERKLGENVL